MKTKLITILKKNVYLIDGYDDENDAYYYMGDYPIFKRYRCLGKLKDLTESDYEGLVESCEADHVENAFLDYTNEERAFDTPKESFLSALEALGLHLNGNPYGNEPFLNDESKWHTPELDSQVMAGLQYDLEKWQEAEQNVFSQETLIFIEQ